MKHELEIKTKTLHQPHDHGRRDPSYHDGNVPPRWGLLAPPQREIHTQKQRERTQSRLKAHIHLHIPPAHKKYRRGLMCAGQSNVHPPESDSFLAESCTSQIKSEQFPNEFVRHLL
jgi:hypothetical protein